jgi:hypothetical protein
MAWYSADYKNRYPVAINVLGGSETAGTEDVQIVVPKDWDDFWNNIRSDAFDVVLTNAEGVQQTFQRQTFNYANRLLTLEADNVTFLNRNSISLMYIYFNNPAQSSDLASSFTASSPKIGTISLGRPSQYAVGNLIQQQGNETPVATFQKTEDEEIYIWFRVGSLLSSRISTYNDHIEYEEVAYVQIESLDAAGSDDIARYSEADTRFIPAWCGAKFKAGANNTSYTLNIKVITSSTGITQKYNARALLRIRNLLPT